MNDRKRGALVAGETMGRASRSARLGRGAKRVVARVGLFCVLASAVACGGANMVPPPQAPPIEGYVVGAPDNLRILILPEPEIERDVRVRPDGMISIDLVGDVQAGGLTPTQIAESIREKITRFKRDAAVSVTVIDSPSQFVTVYGEVSTPGTFSLTAETRVSEAIGQVGGTRPFASLNKIHVVRTDGANTQVLNVRLRDIQKGDLSTNFVVEEGDLIVVPPTGLARVGYAVQMLLFPFQPVISGAASVGAVAGGVNALGR